MQYNGNEVKQNSYIEKTGDYTFKVTKVEEGTSANKGTPFHKFFVESVDGDLSSVTVYLTEGAIWRHKAFASALGFDVSGVVDTDVIKRDAVGRTFIGTVESEIEPAKQVRDLATGQMKDVPEKTYYKINKFKKVSA